MENCSNFITKIYNFLTLFLAFSALISLAEAATSSTPQPSNAYTNFIRVKCNRVTYSKVCVNTLYPYASYVQANALNQCNAALDVAIQGIQSANATVFKLATKKGLTKRDVAALRDCRSDMRSAISELKQTTSAMKHLKGKDRDFQWANAKTYASSAESYVESCRDGFVNNQKMSTLGVKIGSSLTSAEQLISNALFLINHL